MWQIGAADPAHRYPDTERSGSLPAVPIPRTLTRWVMVAAGLPVMAQVAVLALRRPVAKAQGGARLAPAQEREPVQERQPEPTFVGTEPISDELRRGSDLFAVAPPTPTDTSPEDLAASMVPPSVAASKDQDSSE